MSSPYDVGRVQRTSIPSNSLSTDLLPLARYSATRLMGFCPLLSHDGHSAVPQKGRDLLIDLHHLFERQIPGQHFPNGIDVQVRNVAQQKRRWLAKCLSGEFHLQEDKVSIPHLFVSSREQFRKRLQRRACRAVQEQVQFFTVLVDVYERAANVIVARFERLKDFAA